MDKGMPSGEDVSIAKIKQIIQDCREVAGSPPLPADTPQIERDFADSVRMLVAALGDLASAVLRAHGETGQRIPTKGRKPR